MQNLYIKIQDGANAVIDKLYENGHSAFVVGGCVRDFILEKEPHDWDICTDALPKQVMQIFGEKNVRLFNFFRVFERSISTKIHKGGELL